MIHNSYRIHICRKYELGLTVKPIFIIQDLKTGFLNLLYIKTKNKEIKVLIDLVTILDEQQVWQGVQQTLRPKDFGFGFRI